MAYTKPTWVNNSAPAINAANLQAISDTLSCVPIANGGTGATTVAKARKNLGLGDTSGAVPVANGGTGATNAASARTNLGITPANIGAVSKSGDTINGNLTVTGTLNAGSVSASSLPLVPITKGGTNATTAEQARTNLGITDIVSTIESKINNISSRADTVGRINLYGQPGTGGISFAADNTAAWSIPALVINQESFYLVSNITRITVNGQVRAGNGIVNTFLIVNTNTNKWRLHLQIEVEGVIYNRYIDLANA